MAVIPGFLGQIFPVNCHDRLLLVGGTVRDLLLGRECRDSDLIAFLPREELLSLGFREVLPSSGAAVYFMHHPDCGSIEVTRIDSRAGLEGDLLRRDFRCNAMAMDFSGRLIDPLCGEGDLGERLLHVCSDDSFAHDPLRVFRGFRFEADGWRLSPESEELLRTMAFSELFSRMPVERFSGEMLKALSGEKPDRFFARMLQFGPGEVFLPELFRMPDVPAGPLQFHPEGDLFTHSLQVLQRAAAATDDPLTRFCALFHDLGKLATNPADYPRHHGHEEAGAALAPAFCSRLHLPSEYARGLASICRLHGLMNRWDELRDPTKIRVAEQATRAGTAAFLPLVAAADKEGCRAPDGWRHALEVAHMSSRELGIDQEKLHALKIADRSSAVLQKRVEAFRAVPQP